MFFNRAKKALFYFVLSGLFSNLAFADIQKDTLLNKKHGFYIESLFLQPNSDNLKYAVFVSGHQPIHQSWHNQEIEPDFSPAFQIGYHYNFPQSDYGLSIDWLYLNTFDSDDKQASRDTAIATVEFVAPPYDVGPAVFGIKRADSTAHYNFNTIKVNIDKVFYATPNVQAKVFGGANAIRLYQTVQTTFSDMAGSPDIPGQAYPVEADPRFYFETTNSSTYIGAGPDVGVNIQYEANNRFGVVGEFLATLTAGSVSSKDKFKSASKRLLALGIKTSEQEITTPTTAHVVPGLDSNVGLFYKYSCRNNMDVRLEAGYRFAYYFNAVSEIYPDTLVQAGEDASIPEFSTGTMAINSTASDFSPFSLNGAYLKLQVDIM